MHYKELDRRLKKINPEIKVLRYSNSEAKHHYFTDPVYYRGELICSVPHGNIYLYKNKDYTDKNGQPHRGLLSVGKRLISEKAMKWHQMPILIY